VRIGVARPLNAATVSKPVSRNLKWAAQIRVVSDRFLHIDEHQDASSQVMDKITGTESNVAAKIVSRAKITPRS
jgi:hypothetical protein